MGSSRLIKILETQKMFNQGRDLHERTTESELRTILTTLIDCLARVELLIDRVENERVNLKEAKAPPDSA